jgi:ribosome biogenesis GTPase A
MPRPYPGPRSPSLVPGRLSREHERLLGLVRQGQELARTLGNPSLSAEIDQLSASALKPFLFVIVGEVKSGKSSLINALLEAPVCGALGWWETHAWVANISAPQRCSVHCSLSVLLSA